MIEELVKQSPTLLAMLAGIALVFLGFVMPDEFLGIKVKWTRTKSVGCFLCGLVVLAFVAAPWAFDSVIVRKTTLSGIKDRVNNARTGSIAFCIDHNGAVMNEIDALMKMPWSTK